MENKSIRHIHMFESLNEKQKIDVGKLHYENPKKKRPGYFDAEKEVTDEKWLEIKTSIDKYRGAEEWFCFLSSVASAKSILPRKFNELDIKENDFKNILRIIATSPFPAASYVLGEAKIVFPSHADGLKDLCPAYINIKSLTSLSETSKFSLAINLKTLYPEKLTLLPTEIGDKLIKYIEQDASLKNWFGLAHYLAEMKILYPQEELINKTSAKFSREMENGLREYLNSSYIDKHGARDFLYMCRNMKIIAAKEIRITDASFDIVMPEEEPGIEEKIPPPPIVKKYK